GRAAAALFGQEGRQRRARQEGRGGQEARQRPEERRYRPKGGSRTARRKEGRAMRIARIGKIGIAFAIAVFATACAPVPRPLILDEADRVAQGAAAAEARRNAPGAFAHAEQLRKAAAAAFAAGDASGAQILGEHALAAYAHALALARIA